jgi:peptidoglycan hydrolase-like protein with peptidoglycan-binding domain
MAISTITASTLSTSKSGAQGSTPSVKPVPSSDSDTGFTPTPVAKVALSENPVTNGGTITLGSRGPEVAKLKTLLRDAGFYTGVINEEMGSMGVEALKKAKLALKLGGPVDVAGSTTLQALEKAAIARRRQSTLTPRVDQHTLHSPEAEKLSGVSALMMTLARARGGQLPFGPQDAAALKALSDQVYVRGQGHSGAAMAQVMRNAGLPAQFVLKGTVQDIVKTLQTGQNVPLGVESLTGRVQSTTTSRRYGTLTEGALINRDFGAEGHWVSVTGFEGPPSNPTHFLVNDPDSGAQLRMERKELERAAVAPAMWMIHNPRAVLQPGAVAPEVKPSPPVVQPQRDLNAILGEYRPKGASGLTASQDGLPAGVASSKKMALNDLGRLTRYAADFQAAGERFGVPPALLAAIASRESRGGAVLDSRGWGDGGWGFGLMQVDRGSHTPRGGPFSREHIMQAAGILQSSLDAVKAQHPSWPAEQQLRGAVAAYNAGVQNVQTMAGMDLGTTGNDYSNDVWARAQVLTQHFGSKAEPDPNPRLPALLRLGDSGPEVSRLQRALNDFGAQPRLEVDGVFGPSTEKAVRSFQAKAGLEVDGVAGFDTWRALESTDGLEVKPGSTGPLVRELKELLKATGYYTEVINDLMGADGVAALRRAKAALKLGGPSDVAGPTTFEALRKASKRDIRNHPWLQTLGNARLDDGPVSSCVATTLGNLDRLGIPSFEGGTTLDPNNCRGAMVQMIQNGHWTSLPLPGSTERTIRSTYGTVQAQVISADAYERMAFAGQIPSGAIIFQTRHGWSSNEGPYGNDMGIVRDRGRATHNYQTMPPIIYGDAKEVVILVPA